MCALKHSTQRLSNYLIHPNQIKNGVTYHGLITENLIYHMIPTVGTDNQIHFHLTIHHGETKIVENTFFQKTTYDEWYEKKNRLMMNQNIVEYHDIPKEIHNILDLFGGVNQLENEWKDKTHKNVYFYQTFFKRMISILENHPKYSNIVSSCKKMFQNHDNEYIYQPEVELEILFHSSMMRDKNILDKKIDDFLYQTLFQIRMHYSS